VQAKRGLSFLTPKFMIGAGVGAGLFTFVILLVGLGVISKEKIATPQRADRPAPFDLKKVPEVAVTNHFGAKPNPSVEKQNLVQLINTIRTENARDPQKHDAFVLANMQRRPELRGFPFGMGASCRIDKNQGERFESSVQAVRNGLERDMQSTSRDANDAHSPFWTAYQAGTGQQGLDTNHGIAALTQILGPERVTMRLELVKKLGTSSRIEASTAIARAAVFDQDNDVRVAAIKELKNRPQDHASTINDMLMHGMRYPMASAAQHAAVAMLALKREEMLPLLVAFLGEPAPGDPVEKKVDGNAVCEMREVVRINHHRNCLLCHPPASQNVGDSSEVPGLIPIPGNSFPTSPREAYGSMRSQGEPAVRADTTYLRQDFSVMLPVENADPWPEMQRFDFLVRTRVLDAKEAKVQRDRVAARPAGYLSPNHRETLEVLKGLTGRNDVEPTQAAWEQVLTARQGE